jgi:hypothetical protein
MTATGTPAAVSSARVALRVVGGPQQRGVRVEQRHPLLLVPDVVARGPDIDREPVELLEHLGGDAEAAGDVLGVGDDEVDPLAIHQALDVSLDGASPRAAHDVADEQDPNHLAYSTARVSRITVTLI